MSDTDEFWLFKSYADERDIEAVIDVIERGTWWAKGPEVEEFEKRMRARADCDHGVAFNSGTSALFALLSTIDVAGGEVIVPSFTFPATANVVVAAGGAPVFADIERDSLALDSHDVREKLSAETKAIMPIHFAGDVAAEIVELREIADEQGIPLLEDAAHSPGATLAGEPVGSFGRAAMFSFCFNKVLTTGEGGMVVTDSDEIARQLRLFRSHGRDGSGEYVTYGHNLRMSSMTAAIGVAQEEKFDEIVERRREMAAYLNDRMDDIAAITVPRFPDERRSVYQLYNLRLAEGGIQSDLADHLDEHGIPTRVTYNPVHLNRYYRENWGYRQGDFPATEEMSGRILTLPFHLDLNRDNLDRISTHVCSFFNQ